MPTPKAWQDNLERIQKIVSDNARKEPEEPEFDEELFVAVSQQLRQASEALGEGLLDLLDKAPEENRKDVVEGFITGLILSVIQIVVDDGRF